MRVQITKMPLDKAAYGKQVNGSLSLKPGAFGGADYRASDSNSYKGVRESVDEVPRDEANLEAEGGETAFGPITGQSIPDHLKIRGKRHHEGGVPLNLPDDTFIFSDTASLRINDPNVLAMFNKVPKKGGYTPAELAKPYNINKYKSILLDPDSSKLERDTATIMIKNYIMKLGALALVQESMKGFPQGIPAMAKPYMEANGISEEDLMPELKEQADALEQSMASGQQTGMPQEQNPMAAQEMQQMAPDQAMQADQAMLEQQQGVPAYPEQMPSGAPVASPESMAQMQGAMPPPEMMPEQGMMAYGGMPYAMYGMQMGGFDFPYYPEQMAYGGVPKFAGPGNSQVGGGPGDGPGRQAGHKVIKPGDYQSYQGQTYTDKQGEYKYREWRDKVEGSKDYTNAHPTGTGSGPWKGDLCKDMKTPGRAHYGKDANTVLFYAFPHLFDGSKDKPKTSGQWASTYAEWYAKLSACEVEGAQLKKESVSTEESGKEPCLCLNADGSVYKDKDGNTKEAPVIDGVCQPNDPSCGGGGGGETETVMCRCTDPVTGQVKEFPIEKEEECVCQDGSQGQVAMGDSPHWSRPARMNVTRNLLMKTKPAPSNIVTPARAQVEGAYEEYQTKVDTAQSAVNALQNAVMYGMAGSTATKQSQMKDLLGKSLRASMDAVANVQSRNVDRQRETNVQKATIDNSNIMAVNALMNQGLAMTKANKDMQTQAENKKIYNTYGAVMDADMDMAARYNRNQITPQFNEEYELGMMYPTGVQKPFTGAYNPSLEDRAEHYSKRTGNYGEAWDMAYKEAMLNERKKKSMRNGGYVLANNVFPFII